MAFFLFVGAFVLFDFRSFQKYSNTLVVNAGIDDQPSTAEAPPRSATATSTRQRSRNIAYVDIAMAGDSNNVREVLQKDNSESASLQKVQPKCLKKTNIIG